MNEPLVKKEKRLHPMGDGPLVLMCWADNYVMVRRPGRLPSIYSEKEWRKLERLST
jgi:hypothetical protein